MEREIKIRELEVRAGLILAGYTMSDVARELGVTKGHVRNVIRGLGQSKRISEFIDNKAIAVKILVK